MNKLYYEAQFFVNGMFYECIDFKISKNKGINYQNFTHTDYEVIKMIDNKEFPIGFTFELALHPDTLNKFAQLTKSEQDSIVAGAREINSRNEMRNYVETMFQ